MKNIVLLPNTHKRIDRATLDELIARFVSHGCTITAPENTRAMLGTSPDVSYRGDSTLLDGAECVFVLGGDGSMIDAVRRCSGSGIPVAGINFGSVGYLAEIEIHEPSLIDKVIAGQFRVDRRIMLDAAIVRGGNRIPTKFPALNDVVINNGPVPHLMTFEIYADGILADVCRADGIVFATPTGSTAYSMSAGGPVLDPALDCICTTPICPLMLRGRPVVYSGGVVITIKNFNSRGNSHYLTTDSRDASEILAGDVIEIRRSNLTADLIRVKDEGFVSVLRRKMSGCER